LLLRHATFIAINTDRSAALNVRSRALTRCCAGWHAVSINSVLLPPGVPTRHYITLPINNIVHGRCGQTLVLTRLMSIQEQTGVEG